MYIRPNPHANLLRHLEVLLDTTRDGWLAYSPSSERHPAKWQLQSINGWADPFAWYEGHRPGAEGHDYLSIYGQSSFWCCASFVVVPFRPRMAEVNSQREGLAL